MEEYIGIIKIFGGNFAPISTAFCQGQLLSIAENTSLFYLIGTTYGGDGQTTFALPDLRGRAPIHPGQGPGLSSYELSQMAGSENVTLLTSHMPAHTHGVTIVAASSSAGTSGNPQGKYPAQTGAEQDYQGGFNTNMKPYEQNLAVGVVGGSQPFPIIQPCLALNYIICLEGIYPSSN